MLCSRIKYARAVCFPRSGGFHGNLELLDYIKYYRSGITVGQRESLLFLRTSVCHFTKDKLRSCKKKNTFFFGLFKSNARAWRINLSGIFSDVAFSVPELTSKPHLFFLFRSFLRDDQTKRDKT